MREDVFEGFYSFYHLDSISRSSSSLFRCVGFYWIHHCQSAVKRDMERHNRSATCGLAWMAAAPAEARRQRLRRGCRVCGAVAALTARCNWISAVRLSAGQRQKRRVGGCAARRRLCGARRVPARRGCQMSSQTPAPGAPSEALPAAPGATGSGARGSWAYVRNPRAG